MRKVGDIVKIKKFEECKIYDGTPYFIPEMKEYCGKYLKINRVFEFKANPFTKVTWYKVNENDYTFCEDWFEENIVFGSLDVE